MRPCFLLLLLALPASIQAEEIAPVFFRTPDKDTRDRLDVLVKELGDAKAGEPNAGKEREQKGRYWARKGLADTGVWAIPWLAEALEKGPGRVKVNAALALARIADPDAVVALRSHTNAGDDEVRRAVCLALGVFRDPADLGALADLCTNPRNRLGRLAEAALALAKIPGAAPALAGATVKLPDEKKEEGLAAALVLASALADPAARMEPHLDHKSDLVLRSAAAGLLLRPANRDPEPILDVLRRGRGDGNTRALLYYALGTLLPDARAREALLDCATKDREKTAARAAACISLAREWGVTENGPRLERALRGAKDDLAAPLMYALVRSGTDDAIDVLLSEARKTDERRHLPAAALLIHMLASARDGKPHPRQDEILEQLRKSRFEKVSTIAGAAQSARASLATQAKALLAPHDAYGLWSLDWEERTWTLVNAILPEILGLDDLPDWGKHTTPTTGTGQEVDTGRKPVRATPWEQDLISFLGERPYFGPGDLR